MKRNVFSRKIVFFILIIIILIILILSWWFYTPTFKEFINDREIVTSYFNLNIKKDKDVILEAIREGKTISDYSTYNLTTNDNQSVHLRSMLNQLHFRLKILKSARNILTSNSKKDLYPDYYIDARLIFSDNSVIDFYSDGDIFIISQLDSNGNHRYIDNLEYKLLNKDKMDEVINYIKKYGTIQVES